MFYRRRKSRFRYSKIVILGILILLALNAKDIGQFLFPISYSQVISREAKGTGLDALLVTAVVRTESGFNPIAVSAKGARGLMQIMPETGQYVAKKEGFPEFKAELLFDPEYNVKIGVAYINELYQEYRGDTVLVLAAYNAGRGNVNKWLQQQSWTGELSNIDRIPFPETRQFIRKVLFYQKIYRFLYDSTPEKKS